MKKRKKKKDCEATCFCMNCWIDFDRYGFINHLSEKKIYIHMCIHVHTHTQTCTYIYDMISLIISYISLNASSITYILSNLTQIQCVTSVHGCSITVKESMTCLGRKRHVTSLRSHVAKRYFPVRECDTLRTHETRAQSYDA